MDFKKTFSRLQMSVKTVRRQADLGKELAISQDEM